MELDLAVDNILVGVSLVRAPMWLDRDDIITKYHCNKVITNFLRVTQHLGYSIVSLINFQTIETWENGGGSGGDTIPTYSTYLKAVPLRLLQFRAGLGL